MDLPPLRYVRTSDSVNIATYTTGSGPPLLYVQPVGEASCEAMFQTPAIAGAFEAAARRFRLVTFDPRNHGSSDHGIEAMGLDDFLNDICAVADAIGDEPLVLWTVSWSAPLVLEFAARAPERVSHLVLTRPLVRGQDGETPLREALHQLRGVSPEAAGAAYAKVAGVDPAEWGQWFDWCRRTPTRNSC